MRVVKSCSIFRQNFQPDVFAVFSVIRWKFGIFSVLFNGWGMGVGWGVTVDYKSYVTVD